MDESNSAAMASKGGNANVVASSDASARVTADADQSSNYDEQREQKISNEKSDGNKNDTHKEMENDNASPSSKGSDIAEKLTVMTEGSGTSSSEKRKAIDVFHADKENGQMENDNSSPSKQNRYSTHSRNQKTLSRNFSNDTAVNKEQGKKVSQEDDGHEDDNNDDKKSDRSRSIDQSQDTLDMEGEDDSEIARSSSKEPGNRSRRRKNKETTSLIDPVSFAKTIIYQCDYCGAEPLNERWRCLDCANFDSCDSCYKACKHDSLHKFVFISGNDMKIDPTATIDGFYATRAVRKQNSKPLSFTVKKEQEEVNPMDVDDRASNTNIHDNSNKNSETESNTKRKSTSRHDEDMPERQAKIESIFDYIGVSGIQVDDEAASTFLTFYDAYLHIFRNSIKTSYTASGLVTSPVKSDPTNFINKCDLSLACLLSLVISGVSISQISTRSLTSKSSDKKFGVASIQSLFNEDQKEIFPTRSQDPQSTARYKLPAALLGILQQLQVYDEKDMFLHPVPLSNLDYHKHVQRPSDFTTTRTRLLAGDFNDKDADWSKLSLNAITTMIRRFRRTIRRIWHNAMIYYDARSEICEEASKLATIFSKMMELICMRFGIDYSEMLGTEEIERGEPKSTIMDKGIAKILVERAQSDHGGKSSEEQFKSASSTNKKKQRSSRDNSDEIEIIELHESSSKKARKDPRTSTSASSAGQSPSNNHSKILFDDAGTKDTGSRFEEKILKEHTQMRNEIIQLRSQVSSLRDGLRSVVQALKAFSNVKADGIE